MNERLKELMEEAGYAEPALAKRAQVLAALIVMECIAVLDHRKNIAIDEQWNVDEAMSAAAMDIEEHFGSD